MTNFKFQNVKVLHLEPTTNCNAACPQCARMDKNFYNPAINYNELTLTQVKNIVPETFVNQLDKMFMCGNFGDPAAAKDTLEIYQYFRQINPQIVLGMNTNGGLKTTDWWQRLAQIMQHNLDYVVFSIDGLSDTNHIYRVNVNWHKVMENASAFISAGGKAHWDMLVYEHNQHQVEQCRQLAKDLGFVRFRTKVSNRFGDRPVEHLKPPSDYTATTKQSAIDCHALEEKSIYLAANGQFLPCCFYGAELFRLKFPWETATELAKQIENFNVVADTWAQIPEKTCSRNCARSAQSTAFINQWLTEDILK